MLLSLCEPQFPQPKKWEDNSTLLTGWVGRQPSALSWCSIYVSRRSVPSPSQTASPNTHFRAQPIRLQEKNFQVWRNPGHLQSPIRSPKCHDHPPLTPSRKHQTWSPPPHPQRGFSLSLWKAWKEAIPLEALKVSVPILFVIPFIGDISFITLGRWAEPKPWVWGIADPQAACRWKGRLPWDQAEECWAKGNLEKEVWPSISEHGI